MLLLFLESGYHSVDKPVTKTKRMFQNTKKFEDLNEPFLPYAQDALAPHIGTLLFHYEKHHKGYQTNLEKLLEGGPEYKGLPLIDIVKKSFKDKKQGIFNNAAQVWNHNFYWYSMIPKSGGGQPTGQLMDWIVRDFGSFDAFKVQFVEAGKTQFGSGWAWLVYNKSSKKLEIVKTGNAETPITDDNLHPLLTCDVWEHAYYLDFQNRRPDYLDVFMKHLVNWEFAASRLAQV